MLTAQSPIKATTQEYLNVEDIKDNIVILKGCSCSLILQITAVNFNLLSELEQSAIISAYAGLLNSLSFPIQIFICSHKKDISSYLTLLKRQREQQSLEKMKIKIKQYQEFVEKLITENEILDKSFYIVIPFFSLELGVSKTIKNNSHILPFKKEYILEKAKTSLFPKRDHLIKQFNKIGLKAFQLNTKQLIELFFNIYNSESEGQKLNLPTNYQSPYTQIINKKQKTVNTPVKNSQQTKKLEGSLLQKEINKMVQKNKNE